MGATRREPIPLSCTRPCRSSKVHFVVGDQGRGARSRQQDLLDLDVNEYQDGHQSQAMIVTHGIC